MVLYQVAKVLNGLIDFYEWLVIAWCLLSWFPLREGSFIADVAVVVNNIVAPYMGLFRRFIPPVMGIDFSPILGVLVLQVIQSALPRLLLSLA